MRGGEGSSEREDRCREMLSESIGRRVTTGEWAWLQRDGCVGEALSFPDDEQLRLLQEGWSRYQQEEQKDRHPPAKGNEPLGGEFHGLWLSDAEEARAVAVSEALAQIAAGLPEVVEFRASVLGDEPWSADAVPNARDILDPSNYDDLCRLSASLVQRFGWSQRDAEVFVLSGATPEIQPFSAQVELWEIPDEYAKGLLRTRAAITMRVEPWVSEETVVRAYRALRAETGVGRHRKPVGLRELIAFYFALRKLGSNGQPLASWANIARYWNSLETIKRRGWQYADVYDLKPAYEKTRRRLLNEEYSLLGDDDIPPRHPSTTRHCAVRYRSFLNDLAGILQGRRKPSTAAPPTAKPKIQATTVAKRVAKPADDDRRCGQDGRETSNTP